MKNFPNNYWILRLSPVYSKDFELNLLSRVKIRGIFFKIGQGNNKLSLCNIKNIGKTVESIVNNKIPSGIYNISDNKVYNYNDILSYYNPSFIFKIPILLINVIHVLSKLISNRFFHENSIKLISDNIYPSLKIERFIKLNEFLGKK